MDAKPEPQKKPAPAKGKKKAGKKKAAEKERSGSLGFEDKLWASADLLRNNMDPAEYKHVVLGLLFLKYIADAFEERREELRASVDDPDSDNYMDPSEPEEKRADWLESLLEDRDEYTAENVFWVPEEARWTHFQANAKQPTIGKILDDAMDAIEKENPTLKGVLPKIYAMPNLDKYALGKLIDLVSGIGLGSKAHRAKDTLGRVYEYFLSKFASAEGKGGGEFYTPQSVVALLVEMLEPYKGRVYDPCCGSGGMFVQSLKFIEAHDGKRNQITVYGQESNRTTWRMSKMNLAIRGIEANLGPKHADSFHEDLHPDLRADFILSNPPFNISEWGGDRREGDVRWKYGRPPTGNANYAWMQHYLHHLAPGGTAGFVMANGSMSSMSSGEGEIRKRIVEADLVDCVVALPGQLFYATQIPVCLWFLTNGKSGGVAADGTERRDRRGETLFIDARKLGRMETRVHRVLDSEDVAKVADAYHTWRSGGGAYEDVAGFCKSAVLEEIGGHDYVLTPGRYVGAEDVDEDDEPFETKITRLSNQLWKQMEEAATLDSRIRAQLGRLGHHG
ncbi:MAG: type I restriction-modification system subunit M [Nannocystaceae bacterium]